MGPIFMLLSAVCMAGSQVFVRKGVYRAGESFSAIPITVSIGVIFFSLLFFISGEGDKLYLLSWQGFALLGAAGIIHFVVGRFLNYTCLRLIGANRGGALLRTNPFYTIMFAVVFLNEAITINLVLGLLCISGGAVLISLQIGGNVFKMQGRGIIAGLAAAFCYGTSTVLIKAVMAKGFVFPFAAVFISYAAAFPFIAGSLFYQSQRYHLTKLDRVSLSFLVLSGLLVSLAQLLRYVALNLIPASLVQTLQGTNILFVVLFSFLINPSIEVFTKRVLVGIGAMVIGTAVLFL